MSVKLQFTSDAAAELARQTDELIGIIRQALGIGAQLADENAKLRGALHRYQYHIGYCRGCGRQRWQGCRADCEIAQLLKEDE